MDPCLFVKGENIWEEKKQKEIYYQQALGKNK